jgi:phosphonate transport system ATP-binding protein
MVQSPSGPAPALELREVSKAFGAQAVLKGIDLVVPRGQITALLGPSGAGKTTLLRILTGALAPDAGRVSILGNDWRQLSSKRRRLLRRRVGLLYQNDALVPGLSALHNVLMGRLGHWSLTRSLLSLLWPLEKDRALEALREVGLEDRLHARIGALSGGQRQRLLIARLLLQDPEIILADEPAASLDPRLGRKALELLTELARTHGKSLVVSLHDMNLVNDLFDRVLALRGGTWFWEGSPSELNRERIAAIFAEDERAGGERVEE